jgi:hypothetical protein
MRGRVAAIVGLVMACVPPAALRAADPDTDPDPSAVEFFEKQIRPLLAARCFECHGPSKQKGGLRLDSREGVLAGGDTGPAIVPGKPEESLLIEAINYGDLYQMPPKSRLPAGEVASLTKWVEMGAPWPSGAGGATPPAAPSAFDLKARAKHWSFQPLRAEMPPEVHDRAWPFSPIDAFLLARLEANGLRPAPDAPRATWLRRVTFDLTGLPPSPEEIDAFLSDASPQAHEGVVDRLLNSPRYGERWARHWLDLVRYAETSGHEFDYDIPDAWRYRDHVIRAFNADLPYNQFIVEHLAGDLLDQPRRNPADGTNESVQATGFFFLGEGTHSPVDLLEEQAARIDNQIDVVGKAFLGLTIACARCHDHKFDPISQKDYYALSGYLKSSRHQRAFLDPPGRNGDAIAELRSLRAAIAERLDHPAEAPPPARPERDGAVLFEDFDRPAFNGWSVTGDAFGSGPTQPGEIRIQAGGAAPSASFVRPGVAHSGLISNRLQGVLRSPTFTIEHATIHYLASGKGGRINVVIDGFEKIRDPIYGGLTLAVEAGDVPRWYAQDVSMWRGHRAYIEISDGATVDYRGAQATYFPGDGWIAVDAIWFADAPPPAQSETAGDDRALDLNDPDLARLIDRYGELEARLQPPRLAPAILDGTPEDDRVHVRGSTRTLGEVVPRRFLEVFSLPSPREGEAAAGRGGQPAVASEAAPAPPPSGRLELARRLVDPSNPLVARVLVNRVWKHHFGEGLVKTPDDFGAMGQPPSHPELLDWLARRFIAGGWSIKRLHREIVLSRAYRMQSRIDPASEPLDPDNRLLHRMNVRRLEAEALRDAVLAVSGRLVDALYGPSVPPHLTPFQEGRGRPATSGPLDGDGRRSLYLNVRRNFLSPFLTAFDFPAPATCVGRRNISNVPAQALTLLNDPFLIEQSRIWAKRATANGGEPQAVLAGLYRTAFGREPSETERTAALAFLAARSSPDDPLAAWAELCHVLFNTKEFLFIE